MMAKPLRTMLVAGVFGAGALAGAAALTPAGAEGDSSATEPSAATSEARPGRHGHRPELTDEQKQCMTDAGFTRPETRPETPPTDEQRQAVRDAAAACGIELPTRGPGGRGHRPELTDEQKQCMTDAGFTRPETRPETPPTDEQRQAVRDAAAACGIELPAHGPHGPADPDAGTDADASPTSATLAA